MQNFNHKSGWKTLTATGAFLGYRLGLFFAVAVVHISVLWLFAFLGAFVDYSVGARNAFTTLFAVLGLTGSVAAMYVLRSHLMWLVRAPHVALMSKIFQDGALPPSSGQIALAREMVANHFGDRANLWDVRTQINGTLGGITGLVQGVGSLFGRPDDKPGPGPMGPAVWFVLRPAPTAILSHGLRKNSPNPWDAARDGLVLHAQNGKPLIANALRLSAFAWGGTCLAFVLFLWMVALPGPAFLWLIATGVMAWWVKAGLIDAWVMACYLQAYVTASQGQQVNPAWTERLDADFEAYRSMAGRAAPDRNTSTSKSTPMPAAPPPQADPISNTGSTATTAPDHGGAKLHPLTGQPMKPRPTPTKETQPQAAQPSAPVPSATAQTQPAPAGNPMLAASAAPTQPREAASAAPPKPANPLADALSMIAPAAVGAGVAGAPPNAASATPPPTAPQADATPVAPPETPQPVLPQTTTPVEPAPAAPAAPAAPDTAKTVIAPMPIIQETALPEQPLTPPPAPTPPPQPAAEAVPEVAAPTAPAPAPGVQKTVIGAPLPILEEDGPAPTPASHAADDTPVNPWGDFDSAPETVAEPAVDLHAAALPENGGFIDPPVAPEPSEDTGTKTEGDGFVDPPQEGEAFATARTDDATDAEVPITETTESVDTAWAAAEPTPDTGDTAEPATPTADETGDAWGSAETFVETKLEAAQDEVSNTWDTSASDAETRIETAADQVEAAATDLSEKVEDLGIVTQTPGEAASSQDETAPPDAPTAEPEPWDAPASDDQDTEPSAASAPEEETAPEKPAPKPQPKTMISPLPGLSSDTD